MLNSEVKFTELPKLEKPRSRFDMSFSHKTTCNAGELIPVMCSEVYPGDTVTIDFSHVTRMTTPITPVMDNAYMDVYSFFVPNRLVWEHWNEFNGENDSPWKQTIEYEIPQITPPTGGWESTSLAARLGYPVYVDGSQYTQGKTLSYNHLPIRGYCKIWSDWFRDENLKSCAYFPTGDATTTGQTQAAASDYVTDACKGGMLLKVAKPHDYFTSCLPEPSKGPDVSIPLGTKAPVTSRYGSTPYNDATSLAWRNAASGNLIQTTNDLITEGTQISGNWYNATKLGPTYSGTSSTWLQPDNLWADLSNATGATINQLRQAYAIQRFYEAQARGGSRYIEYVQNIFGVISPDARQQRSEFIGGRRFPINMDQVLQTSSTDQETPQGNTAAFSCTVNADNLATYSSTEHGYIFTLLCIRTTHSYQQGVSKHLLRKKFTDYYVPQFAHLGEMPVFNSQIYAQGKGKDDEVFGYQEAWAELRYEPNRISGQLMSQSKDSQGNANSLDIWHYADYYNALPTLGSAWIDETPNNIQRTLAVSGESQFIIDTYFKNVWTRILPLYSVPGLGDHY